jgi:hypothetical protein
LKKSYLYDGILPSSGDALLLHVEKMDVLPGLRVQIPDKYDFETGSFENECHFVRNLQGISNDQ